MIRSAFATIGVLFLSLAAYAAPVGLGYAADYNVFTLGNLGNGSGGIHIVGRVAVGGNVTTSLSVGSPGEYAKEWTAPVSTRFYTYIAGTNGKWNVNQQGPGDAYVGTAGKERINVNDAGDGKKYRAYTAATVPADHALIDFGKARTELSLLSGTIAAQSASGGTVSKGGDNRYTLTATSDAVFNLSADEFKMLKSITTNGHTVLVNVNGTNIRFDGGNNITVDGVQTMGDRAKVANVLFNFRDATSIYLDGALYGSILAPNAALTTNHNLKGQIIVDNLVHSGEIHAAAFTGVLPPTSVPEPATLVLMGSGLFGMWSIRRRMLRR